MTVHNVKEQDAIGKTDTFSVWVTNDGNGVLWGVLPAVT
jgi:hypothetical protein